MNQFLFTNPIQSLKRGGSGGGGVTLNPASSSSPSPSSSASVAESNTSIFPQFRSSSSSSSSLPQTQGAGAGQDAGQARLSIAYTCIFHDDDILLFHDYTNTNTNDNELSKIGIIKGMIEFCCKFDNSQFVQSIQTEKQTFIIIRHLELIVVLCMNHTIGPIMPKAEILAGVIRDGILLFELNHGNIMTCPRRDGLKEWWVRYLEVMLLHNTDHLLAIVVPSDNSIGNRYKKSSMITPMGFQENLKLGIEKKNRDIGGCKLNGLFVMNVSIDDWANYGVVFSYTDPDPPEVDPEGEAEGENQDNASGNVPGHGHGHGRDQGYDNLLHTLQLIDLVNGLNHDVIMDDNLNTVYRGQEDGSNTNTGSSSVPGVSFGSTFWQDPLKPIVYDPINATMDTMNRVGEFLPSWNFWDHYQGEEEEEVRRTAVTSSSPVVGAIAEQTESQQQHDPIITVKKIFVNGRKEQIMIIYRCAKEYQTQLQLDQEENDLVIVMIIDPVEEIPMDEITTFLTEQIYQLYLIDLITKKNKTKEKDKFQYLIINKENYYTSLPMIMGGGKTHSELHHLNNFLISFNNSHGAGKNQVEQSMIKLNYKNYWCFYQYDSIHSRELFILKKVSSNTSSNDNKQDQYKDLKMLFNTKNQGHGHGHASGQQGDHEDKFNTLFGDDVVDFCKLQTKQPWL